MALLAAGIPLAWVWVGSQVQGGTTPSATAIATVVTGCMASYGFVASWRPGSRAVATRSPGAARHERYAWNRSLRDERKTRPGDELPRELPDRDHDRRRR